MLAIIARTLFSRDLRRNRLWAWCHDESTDVRSPFPTSKWSSTLTELRGKGGGAAFRLQKRIRWEIASAHCLRVGSSQHGSEDYRSSCTGNYHHCSNMRHAPFSGKSPKIKGNKPSLADLHASQTWIHQNGTWFFKSITSSLWLLPRTRSWVYKESRTISSVIEIRQKFLKNTSNILTYRLEPSSRCVENRSAIRVGANDNSAIITFTKWLLLMTIGSSSNMVWYVRLAAFTLKTPTLVD